VSVSVSVLVPFLNHNQKSKIRNQKSEIRSLSGVRSKVYLGRVIVVFPAVLHEREPIHITAIPRDVYCNVG
jgi:hypothetical protein